MLLTTCYVEHTIYHYLQFVIVMEVAVKVVLVVMVGAFAVVVEVFVVEVVVIGSSSSEK